VQTARNYLLRGLIELYRFEISVGCNANFFKIGVK